MVKEADLRLNLSLIEALRELLLYVFSHPLYHLRVHPIVAAIFETTLVKANFHAIVHKEVIFIGIINKEGGIRKCLRYGITEMAQSLLNISYH